MKQLKKLQSHRGIDWYWNAENKLLRCISAYFSTTKKNAINCLNADQSIKISEILLFQFENRVQKPIYAVECEQRPNIKSYKY